MIAKIDLLSPRIISSKNAILFQLRHLFNDLPLPVLNSFFGPRREYVEEAKAVSRGVRSSLSCLYKNDTYSPLLHLLLLRPALQRVSYCVRRRGKEEEEALLAICSYALLPARRFVAPFLHLQLFDLSSALPPR